MIDIQRPNCLKDLHTVKGKTWMFDPLFIFFLLPLFFFRLAASRLLVLLLLFRLHKEGVAQRVGSLLTIGTYPINGGAFSTSTQGGPCISNDL